MKTYCGVCDCHGIESFVEKGSTRFPYMMRAEANRQRHAIYYEVVLSDEDKKIIDGFIELKEFTKALDFLKTKEMKIPAHHKKSLSMIPNPDLDPFS